MVIYINVSKMDGHTNIKSLISDLVQDIPKIWERHEKFRGLDSDMKLKYLAAGHKISLPGYLEPRDCTPLI